MSGLPGGPNRKDVLSFISQAASYGNLGAFIGAGFSNAVLDGGALSWRQLLEDVADKLGVDFAEIPKEGVSYPEMASQICEIHAENNNITYQDALSKIKSHIASLTSWYPSKDQRTRFSDHLAELSCSWIITTNYDLVIESLLTGASAPLGPNDSLLAPLGIVPVFHLHGIRTNPNEIIISQEDYVGLFRPTEYRQIKLALMIKESTMLILGYGLGDVNVLTALDWSKNVFSGDDDSYPNEVIQIVRKENPKEEPYRDRNSVVVLETSGLEVFFKEFSEVRLALLEEEKALQGQLETLAKELDDPRESMIEKFIDDTDYRNRVLRILSSFSNDLISGFVSFLDRCIDETWTRAEPDGAFQAYAENLSMILDILTAFTVKQMPPALFQMVAYALQRVAYFVGDNVGRSWAAKRVWDQRSGDISEEMINELIAFGRQHRHINLLKLLGVEP